MRRPRAIVLAASGWRERAPETGCLVALLLAITANSGDAAARLKLLGDFGQYADHGLAGDRQLPVPGLSIPGLCHQRSGGAVAGLPPDRYADKDRPIGKAGQLQRNYPGLPP